MAKAAVKATEQKPRTTRTKTAVSIEKVSEEVLDKLRTLGVEEQLQHDVEWCLGSYRHDGNPVGLYSCVERALPVFKDQREKKTKGVTAKFITDLEKAVNQRNG